MRKGGSPAATYVVGLACFRSAPTCLRGTSPSRGMKLPATSDRRALVAQGQQVARPRHVHHRLHPARLAGVGADVPAGARARGAEQRDEMPAGALPPGPDLGGVDVELRRVRPQVADGALHVDDLVRPVGPWPEPVVEADHHEPLGDQGRPDAVDDEAAGVVVARDPVAAVDVHGGGEWALHAGGLGDPGFLAVAVAHRGRLGRLEDRGGGTGLGRAGGRPGAGGQHGEAEHAEQGEREGSAHRPRSWSIGARTRSHPHFGHVWRRI